ncbi:MAG: hypothetical protein V4719_16655 [Planctomycetota bacterium]
MKNIRFWEGEAPAEPLGLLEIERPSGSAGASPSQYTMESQTTIRLTLAYLKEKGTLTEFQPVVRWRSPRFENLGYPSPASIATQAV